MLRHLTLLIMLVFTQQVQARNLGVVGQTFAILERDLLDLIESRLKDLDDLGELSKHTQKIKAQLAYKIQHPQAGVILPRTQTSKTYTYDPALTVPYDLKDHQGKMFHKAGTKVNPLDLVSLTKELIFFDGNDPEQVSWVQNYMKGQKPLKLILTQGAPFALMEKFEGPLFFDQHGYLSKKLKLTHVPAIVKQEGKKLMIQEIVIEGSH
ncbi:MAG: type-F conjugative transfer system protein TraW [Alphaproteobacteria bacterium]|nr:type-F conjugative transfer system protein TraW [Alphaproteobacteria bacterium]